MTSASDVVTSESPDVNTSISFNVTMAVTNTESLVERLSTATRVRAAIVAIMLLAIVNLCGNGFTLITIRKTPRLWTKTNVILTSMLLSHFITGFTMLWYNPYLLFIRTFNIACRLNVVTTVLTPLMKMTFYVSVLHTFLISAERYIAIVYPLQYETKFTDRTMKLAISAVWATGMLMGMTYWLWLINADSNKCKRVPAAYHLVDVVVIYIPGCICLFTCYGKIFAIARRQRRCIEPQLTNVKPASGLQTAAAVAVATAKYSNKTATITSRHHVVNPNDKSLSGTGASSEPSVTSAAASAELTQEQRRQKVKSRRREFKAVYLTAAIVGSFVVLRFPYMLGRVLASVGYNSVLATHISLIGVAFNFSTTWAIYAAVSKSYRRAYRQMFIRIGCCCCKNVTPQTDNSLIV